MEYRHDTELIINEPDLLDAVDHDSIHVGQQPHSLLHGKFDNSAQATHRKFFWFMQLNV